MKKIIFSLVSVALALVSCGDSAKDVNSVIMKQLQDVANKLEIISHNITADNYDEAKSAIDSLSAQVVVAKTVVTGLSNSKAESYKKSVLEYLSFIETETPPTFLKAIDLFQAAKLREQGDVAAGKQSSNLINSGPDFDAARKVVKDFMKALTKNQEIVIERQEKFLKINKLD